MKNYLYIFLENCLGASWSGQSRQGVCAQTFWRGTDVRYAPAAQRQHVTFAWCDPFRQRLIQVYGIFYGQADGRNFNNIPRHWILSEFIIAFSNDLYIILMAITMTTDFRRVRSCASKLLRFTSKVACNNYYTIIIV